MEGVVNAAHEAVLTLSLEGPAGETRDIAAVIDTGFTGFLTVTPALAVELGLPFEGTARATLADGSETTFPYLESTDRSLKGRAAGLPERSAGVPAFAGRCRSEEPSLSVAQRGSGALRAPARGCARRARACWREPRTRVGAVSGRQAGSGSARNRARAAAHWPAQGQRFARCRVQRRAEWVSRPARAK